MASVYEWPRPRQSDDETCLDHFAIRARALAERLRRGIIWGTIGPFPETPRGGRIGGIIGDRGRLRRGPSALFLQDCRNRRARRRVW
jgi:hypothetical protein